MQIQRLQAMKVVIQRVKESSVEIDGKKVAAIGKGLMVLAGFVNGDVEEDLDWVAKKISALRIFNDSNEVMNLSVKDIDGEILVISQFTLMALTKRGNRPSYINAAKGDIAIPRYERFKSILSKEIEKEVACGVFGADMKVSLINDGPVTIIIDSKNRI